MIGIKAQQKLIANICQHVAYLEQISNQQVQGSWEQAAWNERLDQLREEQEAAIDMRKNMSSERAEVEAHVMEQLFVCRKMHDEMLTLLKKHEGHT